MIGLEDETPAFRCVELRQHCSLQLIAVTGRPHDDVHVAAKTHTMAEAAPQFDHIQARLGLERIVGVDSDFDEVLVDAGGIAASVIDHRQVVRVALLNQCFHARLDEIPNRFLLWGMYSLPEEVSV